MSDNVDDFLAHYGVPGMKWGKRSANPEKYQKKADKKVREADLNYSRLRNEQGRRSKQTKAAKKELKVAKEQAKGAPSLLGAVGGQLARKERYTNPEALQKRNQAGKLAAAGIVAAVAASGLRATSAALEGSRAAKGAAIAGTILSVAGSGLGLGAIAKGADAAITERNARQK